MGNTMIVGADIGGSHITTALINTTNRQVETSTLVRMHVDCHGTAHDIISTWCNAIKQSFANYTGERKVGIAMPGPFDYKNGISLIKGFDKYEALYGLNVKELLAEKLQILPSDILLKNDAGCFLQGEMFAGAAQNYNRVIGFTLGTGFGSALGENGIAEDAELWASPFGESIAEEHFSTRWFLKRYHQISGLLPANVKWVAEQVDTNETAQKVFEEFTANLSSFLVRILGSHQPEVIILGGNIANASHLFLPKLINELTTVNSNVTIHLSQLGEAAAMIGAASLWYNHLQDIANINAVYAA